MAVQGLTVNGGIIESKGTVEGKNTTVNAGKILCDYLSSDVCTISGGNVEAEDTVFANNSIEISGGNVKGNIESQGATITIKGGNVEGSVYADDFTMSSGTVRALSPRWARLPSAADR